MPRELEYFTEKSLFRPPPIGCVLDLKGRPFDGRTILDNSPYGNHGTSPVRHGKNTKWT